MPDRFIYRFFKCERVIWNALGKLRILTVIPGFLGRIKLTSISPKNQPYSYYYGQLEVRSFSNTKTNNFLKVV